MSFYTLSGNLLVQKPSMVSQYLLKKFASHQQLRSTAAADLASLTSHLPRGAHPGRTLCSIPFPDPKTWHRALSPSSSEALALVSPLSLKILVFLTWCDFSCKTVSSSKTRTKLPKNAHSFQMNQFTCSIPLTPILQSFSKSYSLYSALCNN